MHGLDHDGDKWDEEWLATFWIFFSPVFYYRNFDVLKVELPGNGDGWMKDVQKGEELRITLLF